MSTPNWQVLDTWKNKPQGQVWRVQDERGRMGFFKFAFAQQWFDAGPIVGNEWITKNLADRLGLPCADLEVADIYWNGATLHGVVSLPKQDVVLTSWCDLPASVLTNPYAHIRRMDALLSTVAFDVWLTNIDRSSGKNIILYQRPHKHHFHWYLIDHGYALYGSPRKWNIYPAVSRHWHEVHAFYDIPHGWQRWISKSTLLSMAHRIRALPASDLREIIESVPDPLYSRTLKNDTLATLIYRQRVLPRILAHWLHRSGNKEYQP